MQSILDAINEWIKEILIGAINGNLSTMFGDVNEKVGTIAAEVGQTPQGWNASIFSMIQTLSENVIIPLAGLVITYVLCVELISMVTEKNNMHDVDTFMFFKWFFKAWVAVYLVTHTFDITMAVFDVAQRVVSGAAGVIGGNTNIDVTAALSSMQDGLNDMEIPELLLLVMESSLVSLCMKIMSVLITVILYGRMIEIYLYCSVSPIPFATMTNREWGQIGSNYLKSLFALGFQGFLIMICVGIYAVLVNTLTVADNLHSAIFQSPPIPLSCASPCLRPAHLQSQFFTPTDERRVFLGVCTRTQRLNKSKNKGCVQPYQTAAYFLCGGVGSWLAAVLPAEKQCRDKPCCYGNDCGHAPVFPLCHV